MKTKFAISAALAALSIFFADAQELGYRDFGSTVESRPMPADPAAALPNIELWLPSERFAEEMRESMHPAVTMSSVMAFERREQGKEPVKVYILPNQALKVWRINVSNGSAGNWGGSPNSRLDARTLSFPAP